MSEYTVAALMLLTFVQGFIVAWLIWAPMTPFKQGFLNGFVFRNFWGKKK